MSNLGERSQGDMKGGQDKRASYRDRPWGPDNSETMAQRTPLLRKVGRHLHQRQFTAEIPPKLKSNDSHKLSRYYLICDIFNIIHFV